MDYAKEARETMRQTMLFKAALELSDALHRLDSEQEIPKYLDDAWEYLTVAIEKIRKKTD